MSFISFVSMILLPNRQLHGRRVLNGIVKSMTGTYEVSLSSMPQLHALLGVTMHKQACKQAKCCRVLANCTQWHAEDASLTCMRGFGVFNIVSSEDTKMQAGVSMAELTCW